MKRVVMYTISSKYMPWITAQLTEYHVLMFCRVQICIVVYRRT